MRLLADENVPAAAVDALRIAGHDVVWVGIDRRGVADAEVLAWAVSEARILLTFDKDFGDLSRRSTPRSGFGVVLFRTPMPDPGAAGGYLARVISERDDWAGHISIVEPGRVRMRPFDLNRDRRR